MERGTVDRQGQPGSRSPRLGSLHGKSAYPWLRGRWPCAEARADVLTTLRQRSGRPLTAADLGWDGPRPRAPRSALETPYEATATDGASSCSPALLSPVRLSPPGTRRQHRQRLARRTPPRPRRTLPSPTPHRTQRQIPPRPDALRQRPRPSTPAHRRHHRRLRSHPARPPTRRTRHLTPRPRTPPHHHHRPTRPPQRAPSRTRSTQPDSPPADQCLVIRHPAHRLTPADQVNTSP